MPELPEVETVVRTLETLIIGKKIEDIDILYKSIVVDDEETFKKALIGQTFKAIKRRGKYIIFELDNEVFISHLRMEGKYFVVDRDMPINKHIHVIFRLNNHLDLRYQDTRKFGRMELWTKDDDGYKHFKKLGPEPFSDDFNYQYIKDYLKNKHKPIKTILLDQSFVAGIGNIYADEILFKMRVHPSTEASKLTKKNIEDLITFTRETLALAIKAGGTTIRSYTSSLGVTGLFQLSLDVHTKEGEACPICGTTIVKTVVGQRGTYYCPKCQKVKL